MTQKDIELKELLDIEVNSRNNIFEVSYEKPDPLIVAKRQNCHYAILLCALFAYGNARLIVKFLDSLDFSLLDKSDEIIEKELKNHYYRFQNSSDVIAVFKTFKRLKDKSNLEELFYEAYKNENSVLEGIDFVIKKIKEESNYSSAGFDFLVGNSFKRDKNGDIKESNSPYKRWNMYLRWMVRDDNIDLGLWKNIDKKDLILPLDTHTFKVSQKLGLLKNKRYNLKSALEITKKLKEFEANDPIKYDFAIYRLGQEKIF
ncbi:TIGR02757 family protein [Arcobacter sp. AHV-9/2010]|uniref:TIGR02757 family protein n=1 Tax=Arcobacter sp. AHV-9/2010 TaxID=2021861 RepID=UPI00100BDB86|nr:TIGR02757 family protein [Arcobacter sp. CECT 9299]RXJ94741.1 TIGR02757 family protein [Arcobacter sp. CECT 9299]